MCYKIWTANTTSSTTATNTTTTANTSSSTTATSAQLKNNKRSRKNIIGFWFISNNKNKSIYHLYVLGLGKITIYKLA